MAAGHRWWSDAWSTGHDEASWRARDWQSVAHVSGSEEDVATSDIRRKVTTDASMGPAKPPPGEWRDSRPGPATWPRSASQRPSRAFAAQQGRCRSRGPEANSRTFMISKMLTNVLRHDAVRLHLAIRSDGFVEVTDVLACEPVAQLACTQAELEEVVRSNDKQRFTLQTIGGRVYIRAAQGHSMAEVKDHLLLERLQPCPGTPLPVAVHGTYASCWDGIRAVGLRAGGLQGDSARNHVHFAKGLPEDDDVISGMRRSCEIAIYLDVRRALDHGMLLYRSANDVILTPGFNGIVSRDFFQKVLDLRSGVTLFY